MDLSSRAGSYIFLCFFLAAFSDQGLEWAAGHSAGAAISHSGRQPIGSPSILVRTDAFLGFGRISRNDGGSMDRVDCIGCCILQRLAAREFLPLLPLLPLVRHRGTGVLKLPVRQYVAGGGLPGAFLCATGTLAGM